MDIVITYVDGNDPEWQKDYAKCVGTEALVKRYRDWGTLPYLMRGIEKCMPFINNVFLVVASESQIPSWVNRDTVRVVLHKDFIPEQFLPTFNSTAIEMFLHRIEGLDEEYLYMNDDFYPIQPCKPTDFFRNGKLAVSMAYHIFTFCDLFRRHVCGSDRMARHAAGVSKSFFYLRPQHTVAPMLKSLCTELYDNYIEDIHSSISPLRQPYNYNQYLYTDYAYFRGYTFNQRISNKHLSIAMATPQKIRKFIINPKHKIICINDVKISNDRYDRLHVAMHEAFIERFPVKSKYEI